MPQAFRDVDPRELRLPSRRGADPFKLQVQIARFGASSAGMPPPWGGGCAVALKSDGHPLSQPADENVSRVCVVPIHRSAAVEAACTTCGRSQNFGSGGMKR